MYNRILVAVDSSAQARHVVDATAHLARWAGSRVHVLHVDLSDVVYDTVVDLEDDDRAGQTVRTAVDQLIAAGVVADGEVADALDGDVPALILQRAEALGSDLVVLGPSHRGRLGNLLHRSVTDGVRSHASEIDLLLVR